MQQFIPCIEKTVPPDRIFHAAKNAVEINPANRPRATGDPGNVISPLFLAIITTKYWGAKGVELSVSFMDGGTAELKSRILSHLNAWNQYCNVKFSLTNGVGQVRITRTPNGGYWSYLGVDVLSIPQNQPTMNLDSFSMNTPESEYHRVVRHECGHTLGFPHEHSRRQIVQLLDQNKVLEYFGRTQGWSPQTIRQQILTPIDESSIRGTPNADVDSIMTYGFPGSVTLSGQPIPGGLDIDTLDAEFAAKLYPLAVVPPVNPPVNPPTKPPEPPVKPIVIPGFLKDIILGLLTQLIDSQPAGFVKWGLQLALAWLKMYFANNPSAAAMAISDVSQLQVWIDSIFDQWISASKYDWETMLLIAAKRTIDQLLTSAPQNEPVALAWHGPVRKAA